MRNAHRVADVRTAETELMARVPDGTLMQRAAAGLASVCARLLGQVYGARVVASWPGPATTAATRSTRARCWPTAARS